MQIEFRGAAAERIPGLDTVVANAGRQETVADLVASVRGDLLARGYMIGEVHVDGARIPPGALEQEGRSRLLDRVERVEIDVAPAGPFIGETFADCVTASRRLGDLVGEITRAVRVGELAGASDDLASFTESLSVLASAYQDGMQLLARLGIIETGDLDRCQERLAGLQEVLRGVLEGIDLGDLVLVSDTLEYEFPEQLGDLAREFELWSRYLAEDGSEREAHEVADVARDGEVVRDGE